MHWAVIAGFAVAVLGSAPAVAQRAAAEGALELEEVVVTAQKRSENLQEVPLAVSALSSEQLENAGIHNIQDLGQVVPSLSVATAVGFTITSLRGVGSTAIGPGIETPISIYLDGVYYASTTSSLFDFGNIERVEVLKGPQGTLFGRNATGGLISVVSRDPTQQFTSSGSLSYDNFQTAKAKFYVSGGITNTLAADFAVNAGTQGKGWGTNIVTGKDVFRDDHDVTLRSKWVLTPSAATKLTLIGDYTNVSNSMNPQRLAPGTVPNPIYGAAAQPPHDYWDVVNDVSPKFTNRNWGASLKLEHEFSALNFMSLTAYRDSRTTLYWDVDFTEVPWLIGNLVDLESQFSEELQISSKAGGKLDWTAGLYYFDAVGKYAPTAVAGNLFNDLVFAGTPFAGIVDYLQPYGTQPTESVAGYAQGTYALTDSTNLTLGTRYTTEDRKVKGRTDILLTTSPTPIELAPWSPWSKLSFNKWTWRLALDHHFTPDVLGYASYNTGFKSGGFNTQSTTDPSFLPETMKAYELGIKSDLFDRRLRLNVAAFFYDYKNIQVQKVGLSNTGIINGAAAEIKGLDSDFEWLASDALSITGSFAILHGKFTDFTNAPFGAPQGGVPLVPGDATGNDTPKAPRFQSNLMLDWRVGHAGGGAVHLLGTWEQSSRFFTEADNIFEQKAYSRFNAALRWDAANGRYGAKLWVNNLTNEAVLAYSSTLGDGTRDATYQAPRTYGVTFNYNFQ